MTREKLQALTLALLMVVSSFGAVVALSGAAAAANEEIDATDNTVSGEVPANVEDIVVADVDYNASTGGSNVNNVSVNLSAGADASGIGVDDIGNVTLVLTNSSGDTWTTEMAYDAHDVTFEPNGTVDVTNVMIKADVTATASDGDVIDAAYSFNSSTVGTLDTVGTQTVTSDTGFISGRITTPGNDPVENTSVTVVNGTGYDKTTQSDSDGYYTIEVPPGQYDITAEKENFTTASATGVSVTANDTTTRNLVIRPKIFATDLSVSPQDPETTVGDTITYTVTVLNNNGNPEAGVDVSAAVTGGLSTVSITAVQPITDSNGEATFSVTSSDTGTADLEFTATNQKGTQLSDTASATFIPREGDGSIYGEVKYADDGENGEDLVGAKVWTVQLSTFEENKEYVNASVGAAAGDTASFRLVDQDGNVIDNNDYRVQVDEEPGLSVTKQELLNESDTGVGSGFDATDLNGDGYVNLAVTPLPPGNYTLQVAATDSPMVTDFNDVTTFQTSTDLTYEGVEDSLADLDTAATDVTDAFGEYGLTGLYVNKQQGINYVVMTDKAGYSSDFADTFEWADGYYFDDTNKQDIILDVQPEKIRPGFVNITNVGLWEDGMVDEFDNQSDDYYQQVPRDGSVDVIDVEVLSEEGGAYVNGTVTLEVPDDDTADGTEYNFTGEFIDVEGGEIIDTGNDTITIATKTDGEDSRTEAAGTARVYLETDDSIETLERDGDLTTRITADLKESQAEEGDDYTNKTFPGVVKFETGEISGLVTDINNNPVESTVYTKTIEYPDDDTPEATFEVMHQRNSDGTVTLMINRTDKQVTDQPFTIIEDWDVQGASSADDTDPTNVYYNFEDFPEIGVIEGIDVPEDAHGTGVQVATVTGDSLETAKYTISDAPAPADISVMGVSHGNAETGQSVTTPVEVNRTSAANIEIRDAAAAQFEVTNLDPQNTTVTQGDTIDIEATVTNVGDVTQELDVDLVISQPDGTQVVTDTQSVTLPGGGSTTVTFTVDTTGVDAGDYEHQVLVEGAGVSGDLTIESGSTDIVDQYDEDNDGEIDIGELSTAATDYGAGDIGITELSEVAAAYAN